MSQRYIGIFRYIDQVDKDDKDVAVLYSGNRGLLDGVFAQIILIIRVAIE